MREKPDGFILPIGMVFLLIITSLSLSSMHAALMQQKMTRNQTTSVVAFEHAEKALKALEFSDLLLDIVTITETAGYHATFDFPSSAPDFQSYNWLSPDNAFPIPGFSSNLTGDHLQLPVPLAVLETLYFSQDHENPHNNLPVSDVSYRYIRITVRVADKHLNEAAILQSVVRLEYAKTDDAESEFANEPHQISRVSWRQLY